MPFGMNNEHVPLRLIDFDDLSRNQYVITNQFCVHQRETKIPDSNDYKRYSRSSWGSRHQLDRQ